jgi:hypothetical protein
MVRCHHSPPRRHSSKGEQRARADRGSSPRDGSNSRGSVTCGAQEAGCNPVAFGRAVRLGLSPPNLPVSSTAGNPADNRATDGSTPRVPNTGSWRNSAAQRPLKPRVGGSTPSGPTSSARFARASRIALRVCEAGERLSIATDPAGDGACLSSRYLASSILVVRANNHSGHTGG